MRRPATIEHQPLTAQQNQQKQLKSPAAGDVPAPAAVVQ